MKKKNQNPKNKVQKRRIRMMASWIFYALLSAVFASLVAVFGKIGMKNIDSTLATTIRALVMFVFLLAIILVQKKISLVGGIKINEYIFIILAGIAGALSWLFYFLALKSGEATKVASLDRLSIVFILVFAILFLGEKFSLKVAAGIVLIAVGAILTIL
jgi:transporter family protein